MGSNPAGRTILLLRNPAALWSLRGVVRRLAGISKLQPLFAGDDAEAFNGTLSKVELSTLQLESPDSAIALFCRHALSFLRLRSVGKPDGA